VQQTRRHQDGDGNSLPKGQKEDSLDANELWDGSKVLQVSFGCQKEHAEAIETQKHAQVGNQHHPEVAGFE